LETTLLGLVLVLFFRLPLIPSFTAILIALLTLVGTCGVGMALAGVAMIYKSVASVTGLVANLAFLVSGALVPINALGLVFTALKLFFPTTWGIDVLRGVVLNDDSLSMLLREGTLPGLLLQTSLMLAIGWLVFNISLQRARSNGVLGAY
jgi:ABC-2 type transport system permease protein